MFSTEAGLIKPIVYVGIIQNDALLLVDYLKAPNPDKEGWWIPAPGLNFGEDPTERAISVVTSFGLSHSKLILHKVESFVIANSWHLLYHYICNVDGELKPPKDIRGYRWVTLRELETMRDLAHGQWELNVGKSYLSSLSSLRTN